MTEYELDEARVATALLHFLEDSKAENLDARRAAFADAFARVESSPTPTTTPGSDGKKRRRGGEGADPNGAETPFAALLRLLHSTLELNERLPVFRNLALGHGAPGSGADGGGGAFGVGADRGDAAARLASGLNILASPLRLTLRRAPLAPRRVTDLAGASLHAGPLTPLASVESHILRRVVVLDPGYVRWCEGLVGGKIWLWISGASGGHDKDAAGDAADGRDDAEAEAEAEAEAANPEPAEPAEPAEPVSASASISKHAFGRWAVASVESYNPVTGRHACLVEGARVLIPPRRGRPRRRFASRCSSGGTGSSHAARTRPVPSSASAAPRAGRNARGTGGSTTRPRNRPRKARRVPPPRRRRRRRFVSSCFRPRTGGTSITFSSDAPTRCGTSSKNRR